MASPQLPTPAKPLPSQRTLLILGVLLLVGWAALWTVSLTRNRLVGGRHTWLPAWEFLGLDFLSNYYAANHWLRGGDPYSEPFNDPLGRPICYPPVVLPLFAWCGLLSARAAVVVWTVALAAFAVLGAVVAWRTRRQLGLTDLPLPFVLAAVLCSTPVLFALERGNWDLMVLVPLTIAAWALREKSAARDGLAGACLALAAWLKLYPALLVLVFLVQRRYRALGVFAAVCAGLVALYWPQFPQMYANMQAVIQHNTPGGFDPTAHTISGFWKYFFEGWTGTRLAFLARLPATVAACVLVLPVVLGVSWRLWQTPQRERLVFPYLLWLAAAATFMPKTANDYNFFFLPLAVLAVCDRRDGVVVHMLLGLLLLWWQPKLLLIHPKLLFCFKVGGFLALTYCLLRRAAELRAAAVEGTAPPVPDAVPQRRAA